MLKQLKNEIHNQVTSAIKAKQSVSIADVKVHVIDAGSDQVFVQVAGENIGRFSIIEQQYINSTAAAVLDAVKTKFRDAGPEAALAAVKGN